jgi:hypothetical protein
MAAKCQAIARSGQRCASPPRTGGAFCFVHDPSPAAVEERRAASRKGGKARSNLERGRRLLAPALTSEELGRLLSSVLVDVVEGRTAP